MEQFLGLDISNILEILGISVLPISELRGAIPIAIEQFDFPWYYAYIIAVIGNMLPIPLILLFLDKATVILGKIPIFKRLLDWLFSITRKRTGLIEKYERIGLVLFVAVPLPITGAWTGAIASVLMGISFTRALVSIFIGVLIAGVIVTCLTLLGWVGAVIAGVCLLALAGYGIWRSSPA
ncbi:MAG: small multi-drug export protein [Dehalococcoidales bacterium]|nr:small multi-drug export protein [Dehalococcoidales bacterium]